MRPGRPEDLESLTGLFADGVRSGRRDTVPTGARLAQMMGDFDWAARCRVMEATAGGVRGAVLILERPSTRGTVLRLEHAARDPAAERELLEWAVGYARAHAAIGQAWRRRGEPGPLPELGLAAVRRFWRMDRPRLADLPSAALPAGYRLLDGAGGPAAEAWIDTYNRSFADHWDFSPMAVRRGPFSELDVLALAAGGEPAAMVWAHLEEHAADARPQPVGLVASVGTLPAHRRRGLASALVAEALARLRERGAQSASLYVDAMNPTRAHSIYRRLGFEVEFDYEVYETS